MDLESPSLWLLSNVFIFLLVDAPTGACGAACILLGGRHVLVAYVFCFNSVIPDVFHGLGDNSLETYW